MMAQDRPGDTSVLTSLFRHNTWANLKLLEFCAGLGDDQLAATAAGTYGPIRDTLVHVVGAELDYVNRVNGKSPPVRLEGDQFPSFEMLKEAAAWTGREFAEIAVAARAESLVRETDPEQTVVVEYPLSTFLVQAINHATEHRTQISTIITGLGLEPPDMTGWAYMEEKGEFRERRTGANP